MTHKNLSLSGVKLEESEFVIHETEGRIEKSAVDALLDGHLAACRIRHFLPWEQRQKIIDNFWLSTARKPRYGDGIDGVEGYFLGASHIEKTTLEYFKEVEYFRPAITQLFQGTLNPQAYFIAQLNDSQSENLLQVRPAMYQGTPAGDVKAVYWNNSGEFLLLPHDDLAQLSDPRQNDFEIQSVKRVMAVNFYAEVPQGGGQLKVWNIDPDMESRSALGLIHSGFPYPTDLLEEHESMVIDIAPGDLILLNGNLIHAVLTGNANQLQKKRLLITCFMGRHEDGDLIWWT
ncbi:hypothetical protein [Xenorhabdus ehlersii]|uniref:Proline hydroxylase n=2 Tax=Xenorhabdus TaxID=626 RepID=A0A2D0IRY7_9GAMM|nr:hypothetical protein [Xenorhabdus ehlersii]PHM24633.1 proline hydroxylase [Xenorhabdus ehlersii]RKE91270.1 hypothetical protein BDE27_1484 [Xenorhabdus ehlersii]